MTILTNTMKEHSSILSIFVRDHNSITGTKSRRLAAIAVRFELLEFSLFNSTENVLE